MQIPFHRPYMTQDEINAAGECIKNGWLTMGKRTIEFERLFSEYIGSKYSIAVNSCTSALHLALKALGVKEGDEVIVPAMTFVATSEVVLYFGAVPIFADIDKETHLMQPGEVEKKITNKTKAIIPVHYAGQPCDMEDILSIAKMSNIRVIEDAAHSLPASYKGGRVGTLSDITCFSFYATKTLAVGEGGMITTSNDEWADKIKILRLHGISKDAWNRYSKEGSWEYDVFDNGFKYNMTDISASIGIEQLAKLDYMNDRRKYISDKYDQAFSDSEAIIKYKVKSDRLSSYHLYPIKLSLERLKINRAEFIEKLKARGISSSVHFIPLYRFSYYKNLGYNAEEYPNTEWVYERVVSLPIFPSMTDEEINYVIENTLLILKNNEK